MIPGEHIVFIGDVSSIRSQGWQIRDSMLILLPGPKVLVAFLCRWPLDGSVVETILRHSHGGINIDANRIGTSGPSPSIKRRETSRRTGVVPVSSWTAAKAQARGRIERRGSPKAYMACRPGELFGRWPTNLILVHGPDCQCVGTNKVSGLHRPGSPEKASQDRVYGSWKGLRPPQTYYANPDGTEEVPAYDCQHDCPVRLLDEQSGVSTSKASMGRNGSDEAGSTFGLHRKVDTLRGHNDTGTASRFFPTFKSFDAAMAWLQKLIG